MVFSLFQAEKKRSEGLKRRELVLVDKEKCTFVPKKTRECFDQEALCVGHVFLIRLFFNFSIHQESSSAISVQCF